ncbi:Ger(x)C family spore germination protein [Paenibacillus hemerocallicola]|uniref:Ger(X)C family spore germination protein n=1 Tax=Paenibacillus hemerocallicola TaxID=1172614 RepID=A0A5C4TFN4_9BACL|nr:Ger(x)C family spore germination protein [Paenibacillus hemerocallicola]TNJ67954.1 Ger(x)C family spore germination protein [Paenibacillus hemerocallicola]
MKRKTVVFVACISMLLMLSGCWNRRELNDLAIALGIGIDKQGDQYRLSVQIVNPQEIAAKKGGANNSPITIYEETGRTIFECFRRMTTSAPRKIYMSHLRILVISEEVAREGIKNLLDFFARDHELRTDFYVVIAREAKAKQVMGILQPIEKVPANNMFKMLQTSERVWAPTTSVFLDDLLSDLMSKGKEPTLTGIRILGDVQSGSSVDNLKTAETNASIKYSNIGVFREDKLVGWLNEEESKAYNYIVDKIQSTIGTIPCPDGGMLNFEVIRSKTEMKGIVNNGKPAIHLTVRVEQNIGEVACTIDLNKVEMLDLLERQSEEKIKGFIAKTIQNTQKEFGADIFGFGEAIHRDEPKAWEKLQSSWNTIFPELPVQVRVEVKIKRTGTQSNSFLNKMER